MDRYVVDTGQDRVRIFYPVSFNALNLFELNHSTQDKQGNFEEPLTHIAQAREQDMKGRTETGYRC